MQRKNIYTVFNCSEKNHPGFVIVLFFAISPHRVEGVLLGGSQSLPLAGAGDCLEKRHS